MKNNGGDASWFNGKNEIHNIRIHNMVRAVLLDSNQHTNKWFYAAETPEEVYRFKIHSILENISPHFAWHGKNTSIHELRTFGCDIYPIKQYSKKLDDRTK